MTDDRASLLQLLARLSFKLGDFTLSSGGKSDYYIDCRTTTLHAEGARLIGLVSVVRLAMNSMKALALVHAAYNFTLFAGVLYQTSGFPTSKNSRGNFSAVYSDPTQGVCK